METLQPQQADKSIVATNLASSQETDARSYSSPLDDLETGDSNSNTQSSVEDPTAAERVHNQNEIDRDQSQGFLSKQEQGATTNLPESNTYENYEETRECIPMDTSKVDFATNAYRQHVEEKPQQDEGPNEKQIDGKINENETDGCCSKDISEAEENELLQSDEDDENSRENIQTFRSSKAQEDELLKSADEDSIGSAPMQPKEKQNADHYSMHDINNVQRTPQRLNSNENESDGRLQNTKGSSDADADDKDVEHRNNLRILYHFDNSDESSTNDSDRLSSNKDSKGSAGNYNSEKLLRDNECDRNQNEVTINNPSPQWENSPSGALPHDEKSEENLTKQSPKCWSDKKIDNDDSSKDSFESATQHSIAETTDINDFGHEQNKEKNLTKSEMETEQEVWEDKLLPTSTTINQTHQRESVVEHKDWHSFDNSNKSNDLLYNDSQNNNEEHPKLNGDHHQYGAGHHNDTTNDSMTSETHKMKSPNTSKESIQAKLIPPSPLYLPQSEEARAAFHSETNPEEKSETNDNEEYDYDQRVAGENETNLKVSEERIQKQQKDNTDDVAQFSQHISTSHVIAPSKSMPISHDDDASRSSLASLASCSTTASSSQHLVIDHPMDDVKDEIIKPLKICLKRKLSFSSEDGQTEGPQRKHISSNNDQEQKTLIRGDPHHVIHEKLNNMLPISADLNQETILASNSCEKLDFGVKQEQHGLSPVPAFKSLLLQQLEKPIIVPPALKSQLYPIQTPVVPKAVDIAIAAQPPPNPINNVPLLMEKPTALVAMPPPTAQMAATKYLCFKCKSGSFATLAALTEHQITCSPGSRLFPIHPPSAAIKASAAAPSLANKRPIIANYSAALLSPFPSNQNELPAVSVPKKRYYECSSCKTFHENWNLFLHIREKHNRHICLYCTRFFPTAEKLALHLEIKHDLEQTHFNSEEALRQSIPQVENYPMEARFLMCCNCEHVFKQDEQFSQHDCTEFMKACSLCGQKGRHTSQCKAHPDSKRFSKLKKKQDKVSTSPKATATDRPSFDVNIPPSAVVAIHNAVNPTTTLSPNSISNCDSSRVVQLSKPNAVHSEDSDSSSNMVIDESCNANYQPPREPVQPPLHTPLETASVMLAQHQAPSSQLAPEVPSIQQAEDGNKMRLPPLKLMVPKLKLRVPKEFQKSVDDDLSSSETDDGDNDEEVEAEESAYIPGIQNYDNINSSNTNQIELNVDTTPASSQDKDMEKNSSTQSAAEAGNSQDDVAYENGSGDKTVNNTMSLDDDDSLEEQNSNLVRIMQEIERTKMDIKLTKKTSFRQGKPFAEPLLGALSHSSNRSNDHNWSPTPPSSPNSRWFTPRPATISQNESVDQDRLSLNHYDENQAAENETQQSDQSNTQLHPAASSPIRSHVALERRDTIGSDMMDIDESITAQPTQTIFRNEPASNDAESLNTSMESTENEALDTSQTTDNDETACNALSSSQAEQSTSRVNESDTTQELTKLVVEGQTNDAAEDMNDSLAQSTEPNGSEPVNVDEDQEDYGDIDVCGSQEYSYAEISSNRGTPINAEDPVVIPPADGINVANEDTLTVDLQLDQPLDKYEIVDFVRICLKTIYPMCLYCNHARRIAVNGKSLVLHMIGEHRFTATVDSITAEELQADTIVAKLKSFLPQLEDQFFNANSYCTFGNGAFTNPFNERIYECFQCRVVAATHKELYLHNRKMHLRTAILCFMCRANFYSFSEILCHVCPGAPNKVSMFDVKYRCCLCDLDNISSTFRLMVHLRKKHIACDVCLEDCREQSKLSSHVWKHKLHHLCYRCGIAYRNKQDITKHLFWKHGTESTICKKCLQKKWAHVYHFCIPPQNFVCEVCNLCFTRAMYLRVHKRIHTGDFRYPCIEDECEEKFVSRRLLLKHAAVHLRPATPSPAPVEEKENAEIATEEETKPTSLTIHIKSEDHIKKERIDASEMRAEKLKSQTDEKKEFKVEEKVEEKTLGKTEDSTKPSEVPRKRRKKTKRSKVLLEDLNLTAPNLSESDSSGGDDSDSDSKTRSEIDAMPRVMLSPPSEAEGDEEIKGISNTIESEPGKVLQIWQNFLKTQQSPNRETNKTPELQDPSSTIMYGPTHIALSDHDYCILYEPPPPPPPPPSALPKDSEFKKPEIDVNSTPESSPIKRKQSKSPRRTSPRRSDASSSSSDSSSSSGSSCSCGTNCSCSSSNSGSSSSSSSSEESDSSMASNASVKKRHRKKSERDRLRKRSESNSPLKLVNKQSTLEIVDVDDEGGSAKILDVLPPSPPKEPLFYESDLETNESETDEEFYDEHPQKLANDVLVQKRASLMAETKLSPSHNYDIVENSRPSTPSLPEEAITNERPKIKVKKKKRDRKSTCKGHIHGSLEEQNAPAQNINPGFEHRLNATQTAPNSAASLTNPIAADVSLTLQHYNPAPLNIYAPPPPMITLPNEQAFTPRPITMRPYGGGGSHHRMSEGSSCSDADGSLKRSKRARRPNKFYGYTSDDENIVNGPPLIIGSRAFKPQPPPQLTWRKEDLPTPSKSILNNKNKVHRTPKSLSNPNKNNVFNNSLTSISTGKKKSRAPLSGGDKSSRKRPMKKKDPKTDQKLPPIPTLKIRPSQIGFNTTCKPEMPHPAEDGQYTSSDTSSDDDVEPTPTRTAPPSTPLVSAPSTPTLASNVQLPVLPSQPPPPPTPQTKAFNHRIPPALLPNPDFATLQYFKANNIRYPIRPPAGARQAREGESVYCYCRCPYDEVSEMIACDGANCLIEWFHFECVGIMVAPQGKWFCAECRPKYSEELYPSTATGQHNSV